MMWTNIRITGYVLTLLAGLASLANFIGVADYDAATGMIDVRPFSLAMVAGFIGPMIATALASVAAWFRWGK